MGEPMPKPLAVNCNCSADYAILQSQETLPPYELDPMYDDPVLRNRVGQMIAKAMEQRFSKPSPVR